MTPPVQAVLASSLYEGRRSAGYHPHSAVTTGYKAIDDNLGEPFEYGRLHCLSGEPGVGKSILCLNIIVHQLLFAPHCDVTVVDATNGFNVPQLFALLQARAKQRQGAAVTGAGAGTASRPEAPEMSKDALLSCLDRVKVMQVFDFTGVVEALGELRSGPIVHNKSAGPPDGAIADSEDESEDDAPLDWPASQPGEVQSLSAVPTGRERLVILQGLDRISTPLIRRDYVNGHSSMTSLLRSLTQLAYSTETCIILTNTASLPRASEYKSAPMSDAAEDEKPNDSGRNDTEKHRGPIQHYSIFASNLTAPTHARLVDSHVDVHMLMSKLPKSIADAEICYGTGSGGGSARYRSAHVVEVMLDRSGSRTGRWAAFDITDEGILKPVC